MSAPGKASAGKPAGPIVQVFGTPDSQSTRAALRFFKERRIDPHVIDIRRKPMAAGELRRFIERLGARALTDTESKAWRDDGLGYLSMTDDELAGRLLANQQLLRIPLVRVDNQFAAGRDEAAWKSFLATK